MSNRAPAQVIAGPKGPRAVPESKKKEAVHDLVDSLSHLPKVPSVEAGTRVFHSRAAGLRIQITNPADVFDPSTGRRTVARPLAAQFRGHVLILDSKKDAEKIKGIEAYPKYGVGKDAWDAQEFAEVVKEKVVHDLVEKVKAAGPEAAAQVVSALGPIAGLAFEAPATDAEKEAAAAAAKLLAEQK